MAENSRKNEFFERERIAMMAITTSNSMSVKVRFVIFFVSFFFVFNMLINKIFTQYDYLYNLHPIVWNFKP